MNARGRSVTDWRMAHAQKQMMIAMIVCYRNEQQGSGCVLRDDRFAVSSEPDWK
jgi:hypothetical protein